MKKKNRNTVLRLRVTTDEKAKFEHLARLRHTDISELVRQLLHREAAQEGSQQAA